MRALRVGSSNGNDSVATIGGVSWRAIPRDESPLVPPGTVFRDDLDRPRRIVDVTPRGDSGQGRFNLVGHAEISPPDSASVAASHSDEFLCKRFLHPETAHVELLMHRLMADIGLPACEVHLVGDPEPILLVSRASGSPFEGPVDPELAHELGRHCAAAYIFGNADLRPRNTFVDRTVSPPVVTMIDLEHCLFNLALDVSDLVDPFLPSTIDAMDSDELSVRIRRTVLTERTTRRAMGTFLQLDGFDSEPALAFRDGWARTFRSVQALEERILRRLTARVYSEPYLIIGTHAYRRAMARLDIDDIATRIRQDPVKIFPRLAAVRGRDHSRCGNATIDRSTS
jgi:hypothetical protein